ncbi:UvrD-helicase domain-containing protein [Halobacillus sp. A5]|uniref:UvrD-helicase domain-containing protein n=1 Tax=Halobacillus sp. A5 TaxID=2880263 RepID=UPI0020A67C6E|nr:ATP-dependent helicase [Halobacillus sp. A5]MCP3026649.1 ATP-dependent helicase [Halobacillus sp. A5]
MKYIRKEDWKPKQGIILEDQANEIVRTEKNSSVLAGPGAGKTELLGQKASYLLETNSSRSPKKILAISYKKDSARNLKDRVIQRCGQELAERFESRTFDSFAKNIIDRFRDGLPGNLRPTKDYKIKYIFSKDVKELFDMMGNPKNFPWEFISYNNFALDHASELLPIEENKINNLEGYYKWRMWSLLLKEQGQSELTFPMISRLAEYLMRTNPKLTFALKETYSHVFLDEFQDTTTNQYDLLKTCFINSNVVLTAVGDIKQRIMGWAGALPEAFKDFDTDFNSERYELILNHRSTERLIEVQASIVEDILGVKPNTQYPSYKKGDIQSECGILEYVNDHEESKHIADRINKWLQFESLLPRDICILVRKLPDLYSKSLIHELDLLGIHARVEHKWQELLSENCMPLLLSSLKLATITRDAEAWIELSKFLKRVRGSYVIEDYKQDLTTDQFLKELKTNLSNDNRIEEILWSIINFAGKDLIRSTFPEYSQEANLTRVIKETSDFLEQSLVKQKGNWLYAIEDFLGLYSIPIMSIHKSKGLEFDSVILMGLEDGAFHKYEDNRIEENYTFFVALSRAKRNFYVSYNSGRFGSQKRMKVDPIYKMLEKAKVKAL